MHRPRGPPRTAPAMAASTSGAGEPAAAARGVVGLITTAGCRHCRAAKATLRRLGVAYREVDLAAAPAALAAVRAASGQRTVPQLFVAGELLPGGNAALQALPPAALARRLAQNPGAPAFPPAGAAALPAAGEGAGAGVGEGPAGVPDLAGRPELDFDAVRFLLGLRRRVAAPARASGDAAGDAAALRAAVGAAEPALGPGGQARAAELLEQLGLLAVEPTAAGGPLNGALRWPIAPRAPGAVAEDLRAQISALYDAHLAEDGSAVDYRGMAASEAFAAYVDATSELQRVDVSGLSRAEKTAFWINIYNALVVHGTAALGAPEGLLARLKFFGALQYEIGGARFSCNDIEHGVLRGNASSPASLGAVLGLPDVPLLNPKTFRRGDPRLKQVVAPPDPRIHFALVCGAVSCPPIQIYDAANLDEGLEDAGVAFCEGEVAVDAAARTVTLSKIFQWYGRDFGRTRREQLERIAGFLPEARRGPLLDLAADPGARVVFREYDWSINSTDAAALTRLASHALEE